MSGNFPNNLNLNNEFLGKKTELVEKANITENEDKKEDLKEEGTKKNGKINNPLALEEKKRRFKKRLKRKEDLNQGRFEEDLLEIRNASRNENKIEKEKKRAIELDEEEEKLKDYKFKFIKKKLQEQNYYELKYDYNNDESLNKIKYMKGDNFYFYMKADILICEKLYRLLKITNSLYDYYGFNEFFKEMKNLNLNVFAANKNLVSLKNRIGLIYYLYENKLCKDITKEDVNELTNIINNVLDTKHFLDLFYGFNRALHLEKGDFYGFNRALYLEKGDDEKRCKALGFYIQDIYIHRYLMDNLNQISVRKNIYNFLQGLYSNCIYLNELIIEQIHDLYKILKKGNENINLIKTMNENIHETFKKHVFLKDVKMQRLLGADEISWKYVDITSDLKKDLSINLERIGKNVEEVLSRIYILGGNE